MPPDPRSATCACWTTPSARSLHLIEDAAQSLASCRYRGAHLGTYGAAGCFSFSTHKLVSMGNGGAVVTDDEALCQRMRLVKDFGRPTAGIDRHETVGYNFTFTDLQAVVGIERMKKLPARAERKKAIFARYRERLSEVAGVSFLATDLAAVTPWFMDILVEPGRRDPLAAYSEGSRDRDAALLSGDPYASAIRRRQRGFPVARRSVGPRAVATILAPPD